MGAEARKPSQRTDVWLFYWTRLRVPGYNCAGAGIVMSTLVRSDAECGPCVPCAADRTDTRTGDGIDGRARAGAAVMEDVNFAGDALAACEDGGGIEEDVEGDDQSAGIDMLWRGGRADRGTGWTSPQDAQGPAHASLASRLRAGRAPCPRPPCRPRYSRRAPRPH